MTGETTNQESKTATEQRVKRHRMHQSIWIAYSISVYILVLESIAKLYRVTYFCQYRDSSKFERFASIQENNCCCLSGTMRIYSRLNLK
jgi:hypothetical protein